MSSVDEPTPYQLSRLAATIKAGNSRKSATDALDEALEVWDKATDVVARRQAIANDITEARERKNRQEFLANNPDEVRLDLRATNGSSPMLDWWNDNVPRRLQRKTLRGFEKTLEEVGYWDTSHYVYDLKRARDLIVEQQRGAEVLRKRREAESKRRRRAALAAESKLSRKNRRRKA